MRYRIEYHAEVMEDLREIPANLQGRIRRAIETRLGNAPDLYGERLVKDLAGLWKLRVGDYRVAFELNPQKFRVLIWCIRNRKFVYPETQRRWKRK